MPVYIQPDIQRKALYMPAYLSAPASDLFSLGLVLVEALSGRRAIADIDAAMSKEPPPLPPEVLESPLRSVLRKATQPRRGMGYATAEEMLHDLLSTPTSISSPAPQSSHKTVSITESEPATRYREASPQVEVRPAASRVKEIMSDPNALPTPDYNAMAADFDRFLPLIHPVSLALLDRLPALAADALVLDVACGTGEPGLTLARRAGAIRLLGVDSAAAMIAVAQRKAAGEALANVRFEVMPSESLALGDKSVDAVISRFGLLLFGDVPASARELARVLRPGGHFSLAVWDDPAKNTLVNAMMTAVRPHLPKEHVSPMERLKEWSADEARTRLLKDAGLGVVRSEMFSWMYRFAGFEDAWDLLSLMGGFTGQAALPAEAQRDVKRELSASLAAYQQATGEYVIPHACRLIWGQR